MHDTTNDEKTKIDVNDTLSEYFVLDNLEIEEKYLMVLNDFRAFKKYSTNHYSFLLRNP